MAIREVLTWPNPFLKKKAAQVELFNAELQTLIEDMRETMLAEDGIGLAATQIGENQRLFIIDRCAFEREREPGEIIALINPEVVEESDEQVADLEGCLSFPEVYIKVKRPHWVKFRAQDPQGDYFEVEGEALGARALLHELDHLEGKVMTDQVPFPVRTRALKKHQRIQRELRQERARNLVTE
ncbi:MAG: peptide deformylase [Myxococcota bacterium]|nr:peptide deformylase [Myxococcota bacterium]